MGKKRKLGEWRADPLREYPADWEIELLPGAPLHSACEALEEVCNAGDLAGRAERIKLAERVRVFLADVAFAVYLVRQAVNQPNPWPDDFIQVWKTVLWWGEEQSAPPAAADQAADQEGGAK